MSRVQVPRDFCQTRILKSIYFRQPSADSAAGGAVVQDSGWTVKTMDWNKTHAPVVAGEKQAGFDVHTIS